MAKSKTKRSKKVRTEPDSVYFLKILLFFIIGSLWLRHTGKELLPGIDSFPIGLVIGLIFARHEHFKIDRKIEYAILLAASVLSFVAPIGIVVEF